MLFFCLLAHSANACNSRRQAEEHPQLGIQLRCPGEVAGSLTPKCICQWAGSAGVQPRHSTKSLPRFSSQLCCHNLLHWLSEIFISKKHLDHTWVYVLGSSQRNSNNPEPFKLNSSCWHNNNLRGILLENGYRKIISWSSKPALLLEQVCFNNKILGRGIQFQLSGLISFVQSCLPV